VSKNKNAQRLPLLHGTWTISGLDNLDSRQFAGTLFVRLLTMALFHVAPRTAADFPQWSLWRRKGTALRRRRPPCGGLSLRCAVTRPRRSDSTPLRRRLATR